LVEHQPRTDRERDQNQKVEGADYAYEAHTPVGCRQSRVLLTAEQASQTAPDGRDRVGKKAEEEEKK
jgi:hypothetical protein